MNTTPFYLAYHFRSKHIPQLPLVFLLSMTSPSSNYLNATYPQGTLALLRLRNFTALAGLTVLQQILLKVSDFLKPNMYLILKSF